MFKLAKLDDWVKSERNLSKDTPTLSATAASSALPSPSLKLFSHPNLFYLNWPIQATRRAAGTLTRRPNSIQLLKELPPNVDLNELTLYHPIQLRWKNQQGEIERLEIILCTNHPFDDNDEPAIIDKEQSPQPEIKNNINNIGLLISNLQKAVRRQQNTVAVRTSLQLLQLDPVALLRRLTIIMLEDTKLHECFTTLVWLMMALSAKDKSTGNSNSNNHVVWKLTQRQQEYILGCVHVISSSSEKDFIGGGGIKNYPKSSHLNQLLGLKSGVEIIPEHLTLLYALRFRRAYGGMHGDMRMIDHFSTKWMKRMTTASTSSLPIHPPLTDKIRLISTEMAPLQKTDILPEAVDFHVWRRMPKLLHDKFPSIDPEEIKKAIWYKRSGANVRTRLTTTEWDDIWERIESKVESMSRFYIGVRSK